MQSKSNDLIDARTFVEIWASLSKNEQQLIKYKVFERKHCATKQAFSLWIHGKRRPSGDDRKESIARIISDVIGKKVYANTLFPTITAQRV